MIPSTEERPEDGGPRKGTDGEATLQVGRCPNEWRKIVEKLRTSRISIKCLNGVSLEIGEIIFKSFIKLRVCPRKGYSVIPTWDWTGSYSVVGGPCRVQTIFIVALRSSVPLVLPVNLRDRKVLESSSSLFSTRCRSGGGRNPVSFYLRRSPTTDWRETSRSEELEEGPGTYRELM